MQNIMILAKVADNVPYGQVKMPIKIWKGAEFSQIFTEFYQ